MGEAAKLVAAEQWEADELLVTLEPDGTGNFDVQQDIAATPLESDTGEDNEAAEHRQVVFLDARTLRVGARRSR